MSQQPDLGQPPDQPFYLSFPPPSLPPASLPGAPDGAAAAPDGAPTPGVLAAGIPGTDVAALGPAAPDGQNPSLPPGPDPIPAPAPAPGPSPTGTGTAAAPTPVPPPAPGRARRQPRSPRFDGPLALELAHLHKSFGAKHAVDDLSLAVPPGVLFGLVGPNGAGKTTTLSMATGLLRPDYGSAAVWGHDVWADPPAAKALMGVLPDGMRLFDRLSGLEMIQMVGTLRRMPKAEVDARAHALLEALGLGADAQTMVADYSAGMTKKIGLACALVHNPRLLLLDEPFEAVDPVSGQAIRAILDQFVDAGGTVVMSSHVMELVESLCDAVAVIAQGRVLAAGAIAEVCDGLPLQQRFLRLVGAHEVERGSLAWLGRSSSSTSS